MKPLLPIALLLAGPAVAADTMPVSGTRLEISATGTVTRTPDVATIGAGVVTQAAAAGDAMAANARQMSATIASLRKAGVADRDIQTRSISLNPQYRYADNKPPELTGYQAANHVSVRLRDIARAGAVLDALVAAGANQIDGPNFSVDKPEAALDEARTVALKTARERAELYANAAGLRVSRIVRISEAGSAQPPAPRPFAMAATRKLADTPVASGEEDLSATLSVTFELN